MISRIHSKLGTAGLVVAVVALVVALTGVAVAAAGLNGKQKKEVKNIAKQYAGKNGAPGATGPAGPQGAKGDAGAEGKEGKQGTPGTPGKNGGDGEDGACSIANPECILPSGATETGTWAVGPGGLPSVVALPFNLRLENTPKKMHYVNSKGEEQKENSLEFQAPVNCTGAATEPTAPAGEVCIYASFESAEPPPTFFPIGAFPKLFKDGATIYFIGAEAVGLGTYAVTAE